jgi:outer membrane protein TolC
MRYLVLVYSLVLSPELYSKTLDWQALVLETASHNSDLLVSKEALSKAEAQVRSAWGPFLPQLTGSISYSHGNASSASGNVPGSGSNASAGTVFGVVTTTDQYSLALNASQNIFNGFQDSAKLNQARAALASVAASYRGQKARVGQSLKKAYAQVLYAHQAILLAKNFEKRRQDNFELVSLRFEGGRENKGSFLKSKAQLRQALFEVSQSKRNCEVARQQLAAVLGRPELGEDEIRGELKTKANPPLAAQPRDLAKSTPAVEQSTADLQAAQASVSVAASSLFPSINLNGSLSKVGLSFPPETNRWSVGMSISIPVFRYGDWETISGAKADERRAEHSLQSADRQAATLLASALAKFQIAGEKAEVQSEVREAAEARAEIARAQYTSGLIAYSEWDIIESDLITQSQNLLSSRLDAVNAEADWEQALGQGDIP